MKKDAQKPAQKPEDEEKDNFIESILGESMSIDAIIQRLKEACMVTSDKQLATILNINRQNIGAARRRKKIPPDWIIDIGKKYNISIDWLFYGEGSKSEKILSTNDTSGCSTVDLNLLEDIIAGAEKYIFENKLELNPSKKAKLIVILYEQFHMSGGFEYGTFERFMRLGAHS